MEQWIATILPLFTLPAPRAAMLNGTSIRSITPILGVATILKDDNWMDVCFYVF